MDDFVNVVNRRWEKTDSIQLAAYVLWRLNYIHPFINGNGRTARAACYFVLCVKAGGWLGGNVILPELLRQEKPKYVEALKKVDKTIQGSCEDPDLTPLSDFMLKMLEKQLDNEK